MSETEIVNGIGMRCLSCNNEFGALLFMKRTHKYITLNIANLFSDFNIKPICKQCNDKLVKPKGNKIDPKP